MVVYFPKRATLVIDINAHGIKLDTYQDPSRLIVGQFDYRRVMPTVIENDDGTCTLEEHDIRNLLCCTIIRFVKPGAIQPWYTPDGVPDEKKLFDLAFCTIGQNEVADIGNRGYGNYSEARFKVRVVSKSTG